MVCVMWYLICECTECDSCYIRCGDEWHFAFSCRCDDAVFILDAGLVLELGKVLCLVLVICVMLQLNDI